MVAGGRGEGGGIPIPPLQPLYYRIGETLKIIIVCMHACPEGGGKGLQGYSPPPHGPNYEVYTLDLEEVIR